LVTGAKYTKAANLLEIPAKTVQDEN